MKLQLPYEKNGKYEWYVLPYHKSNLVYTAFFPQFLIFQKNTGHYYFVEKLKIVKKNCVN